MDNRISSVVDQLVSYYKNGFFPMAEEGEIFLHKPDPRAIIPLENYKVQKSLKPVLNKGIFEIKINKNFNAVINACAKPRSTDDGVWISDQLISWYLQMHVAGYAHSVESYYDNKLVGGLYGISIGSAFFGESMFHTKANASKVAFHYLINRLKAREFLLLDTQYINDNVKRFGAIEIENEKYEELLMKATSIPNSFNPDCL